jgi:hypothetical protein
MSLKLSSFLHWGGCTISFQQDDVTLRMMIWLGYDGMDGIGSSTCLPLLSFIYKNYIFNAIGYRTDFITTPIISYSRLPHPSTHNRTSISISSSTFTSFPAMDKPGPISPLADAIQSVHPIPLVTPTPTPTPLNGNGMGREKLTMLNDIRFLDCGAFVGVAILDLQILISALFFFIIFV